MATRREKMELEATFTDRASKGVGELADAVKDLDGETAEVELKADSEKADESIEAVGKALDDIDGETAEAKISADDSAAEAEVDAIMRRLADLDDEEVVAVLSAKATKLEAEIKNANSLLSTIDGDSATAIVNAKDEASAKLRAIRARLTDIDGGLDSVSKSGDQSRSVLANLAGNAAQDLGELGGVVGTLGVGVGQLAEYAVDGNIAMKNLAKVAGPLAGVALATTAISEAFDAIRTEKAFNAQLVEDFAAALREGQTVAQTLLETIQETGDLNFETGIFGGGGLLGLGSQTRDLIPLFAELGLTYEDFVRLLNDPTGPQQLRAMKDDFLELATSAETDELGDSYQRQAEAARDAAEGLEDYQASTAAALDEQAELDTFLGRSADSLTRLNERLAEHKDPMETLPDLWDALIQDAKDGTLEWENAAGAVEQLTEATGLSEDAIVSLIDQEADKALQADADAVDTLASAFGAAIPPTEDLASTIGDGLVSAVGDAVGAAQDHADALRDEQIAALEEEQAQLEGNIETLEAYIDAQRSSYDSKVDYREATEDAEDALADYQNALTEVDEETGQLAASQEEINDLGEDFVDSVLAQSDALVQMKRDEAAARGETYSATQAIEDQNAALLATASTIPDELLPQFAEMITTVNGIPEEKETILTMLREGADPEEILTWLNDISKTRKASIDVAMNESHRQYVEKQKNALAAGTGFTVTANANFTAVYNSLAALQRALAIARLARTLTGLATGSPHTSAGTFLVGEQGPELVTLPAGSQVTNATQTGEMLRNAGGDSHYVNITHNWPRGIVSRDVAALLRRQQRVQGRAF